MEAKCFQDDMSLRNPLVFLYLSITEGMGKPLILDPHYKEEENSHNSRLINKMVRHLQGSFVHIIKEGGGIPCIKQYPLFSQIARDFKSHPDSEAMIKIGLNEETVTEWVVGNPSVRRNKKFNGMLTRLWSALFVKELLNKPENFEELCLAYGIDRPSALEMTSSLASRCQNLKSLCAKLNNFWWYPPLATSIMKKQDTGMETIDHIFLVPGHTRMECNDKQSVIERAKDRVATVDLPEEWYDLVNKAGQKDLDRSR